MTKKKMESLFLVFLTAAAGVFFYMCSITKVNLPEPLTARAYGMIISGLFLFAIITRLVKLLMTKEDDGEKFKIAEPKLIAIALVAMIVYTVGIIKIGYYVMTFAYTFLMIMLLRETRTKKAWILTAIGCLVFTLALYGVFTVFNVFLPNAWLI